MDVSDAIKLVLHLFGGLPVTCLDALDADDTGALNVTDAVVLLNYLFKMGVAPAAPFPANGPDPTTGDPLDCAQGL